MTTPRKPVPSSCRLHCTCQHPGCRNRAEFEAPTLVDARRLADEAGWTWPHRICPRCKPQVLAVTVESEGEEQ